MYLVMFLKVPNQIPASGFLEWLLPKSDLLHSVWNDTNELTYKAERDSDVENELTVAEGEVIVRDFGRLCALCYI